MTQVEHQFNVIRSSSEDGMRITTFNNYEKALLSFANECRYGLDNENYVGIMKNNNKNIGYEYNCRESQVCIFPITYNSDKEYKDKLEEIKPMIAERDIRGLIKNMRKVED